MYLFNNKEYKTFDEADLFICAIGYEERSKYLLEENQSSRKKENTFAIVFNDHYDENIRSQAQKLFASRDITTINVNYSDFSFVNSKINEFITQKCINSGKDVIVHIDYSSMPRSWYCRFPMLLNEIKIPNCIFNFWYVSGDYPTQYSAYPSAGIEAITAFSGRPSLMPSKNRYHIIALGYDIVRTQAIISITDPSYLVSCYAYIPTNIETKKSVEKANEQIIDQSALALALTLDNFTYMIMKLKEIVNELLSSGDVILIPDGPKPLILAMSLIPNIVNREGVSCLHVLRNEKDFNKVKVKPIKDSIYGFSIFNSKE